MQQFSTDNLRLLILAGFSGYIGSIMTSLPRRIMDYLLYLFSRKIRVVQESLEQDSFMWIYYGVRSLSHKSVYCKHLGAMYKMRVMNNTFRALSESDLYSEFIKDETERKSSITQDGWVNKYRPLPLGTYWIYLGSLTWMRVTYSENMSRGSGNNNKDIDKIVKVIDISFVGMKSKKFIDYLNGIENRVEMLTSEYRVKNRTKPCEFIHLQASERELITMIGRSKDSIFLDNKDFIFDSIERFLKPENYDKYKRLNIPYKFNILLYGKPGTGKTSLAKSLATEFTMGCIIPFNEKLIFDDEIKYDRKTGKVSSLLLIEEIDTLTINRMETEEDGGDFSKLTAKFKANDLRSMLEILDGAKTPSVLFSVSTTNHIEKLDPALRRRFDLEVCVDDMSLETAKKMCEFYGVDESALDEFKRTEDGKFNGAKLSRELLTK